MLKKYLITLNGCDDTTECEIELTKEQLEIFMQIAKEINEKSTYGCQPTISIYENYEKDNNGYFHYWDNKCVDLLKKESDK